MRRGTLAIGIAGIMICSSLLIGCSDNGVESVQSAETSLARDPADLPPPIGDRPPELVRVDLETNELEGNLRGNSTYTYWTFNGQVPGPFIRVRVGDTG